MIRFENDFVGGAHPLILEQFIATNNVQTSGYGTDEYSEKARELIREACKTPEAGVHFIVGGTLTNKLVIASMLRPHQGVISAESGHIANHETGAIEASGHKVLTLPTPDGKLTAEQIATYVDEHFANPARVHYVQPGMVYISFSTENGTAHSLAELQAIHDVCKERNLPLFIDGARLGYGIAASDVSLEDIARLSDIFYIGGNKIGAFFGEALVIPNQKYQADMTYIIKQNGALFAKGRLLGIQFATLFTDGLYEKISLHAVTQGQKLRDAFISAGFDLLYDSPTNLQFPILPNEMVAELGKKYGFSVWGAYDEKHSIVRFCTSWSTDEAHVEALIEDVKRLAK